MGKEAIRKQRLLTIAQAAEYMGRTIYSMRTLIWNGEIPIVRRPGGKKMWVDLVDLDRFIAQNKVLFR